MGNSYGSAVSPSAVNLYGKRFLFRTLLFSDLWIRNFQSTGEFQQSLNKDVDLCFTYSQRRNDATIMKLMAHGISFTQKTVRIPFLFRHQFHNMKRIFIIQVNRNRYDDACYVVRHMEPQLRCKLKEYAY